MNSDEIKHYGVPGMKWGVHKNIKKLAKANENNNEKKRESALNNLEKHHTRISNKIKKYDEIINNNKKIQYKIDTKYKPKVSKYEKAGYYYEKKAKKAKDDISKEKFNLKANEYYNKSKKLKNKYVDIESDLKKNKAIRNLYSEYLTNVDKELIKNGRKILNNIK